MTNCFNKSKAGFTLIEILVAVLIVAVLAAMAVPMYERTIEKSRRGEVSVTLKRLGDAKLRTMTNMDLDTFNNEFTKNQLDSGFSDNDDFHYSLYPTQFPNGVCAVRLRGSGQGTIFLYLGEIAAEACPSGTYGADTVCGLYRTKGQRFFCAGSKCNAYGMDSVSNTITCN
ncbi:MAG: prepilin-type N-terminal cleavage/methylation domain-containing protein [Elusimicrobiaceae bacterium]|nr:prepilin-type N-terminal cleavage/methylation domain-containing protein [Elusimicrobiaceae bacterium]